MFGPGLVASFGGRAFLEEGSLGEVGLRLIVWCGGLNRNGSHRFMCLNAWPIEDDTVRRCGLIGIGVALLEEVCPCGLRGFRCSVRPHLHSLLPLAD